MADLGVANLGMADLNRMPPECNAVNVIRLCHSHCWLAQLTRACRYVYDMIWSQASACFSKLISTADQCLYFLQQGRKILEINPDNDIIKSMKGLLDNKLEDQVGLINIQSYMRTYCTAVYFFASKRIIIGIWPTQKVVHATNKLPVRYST